MKYPQRIKKGRVIPFGYKVNAYDPKLLDPIPEQLDLLAQAFIYLRTCSCREVRNWLVSKSGRKLTSMGLWKLYAKLKTGRNAIYYENRKKAETRRRLEDIDREQRRAVAEAKENQGKGLPT